MEKVINNRRYNTATAQEIGHAESGLTGDLDWWSETLYQKRNGEFFLAGEGGARTDYARPTGTENLTGGEKIVPLTLEEAKKWVEENMTAEDYEKLFSPDADPSGEKVWVNTRLTPEAIKKAKMMVAAGHGTVSQAIEDALMAYKI